MKFFSGFLLRGEEKLFESYLISSRYTVAGFSYGAQKALEYALHTEERVERLILLSPAFFNTESDAFVRTQKHYFNTNKTQYIQNFLTNVSFPCNQVKLETYLDDGSIEQLEELLTYKWEKDTLVLLKNRGIKIEVFLGSEDKIIDSKAAFDFFSKYTTTYLIKKAGHLLNAQ